MHIITIQKNEVIAKDTHKIRAVVDAQTPLSFKAGQFCMVNIPHETETVPRAFSFGNDASDPNNIIFYVKILRDETEHIASPYFEHCTIGDKLTIEKPAGLLTLPEKLPEKIVYLATTTGIAPFLSHMYELARINPNQYIDLIFGCRHDDDILAQQELHLLQSKLPNLSIITTLSQPSSAWTGHTGRVTDYLTPCAPKDDVIYFLCGNKFMIIDARKILTNQGCETKRIKFEIFF